MQAGFVRYGEERILAPARRPDAAGAVDARSAPPASASGPPTPLDALAAGPAVRAGDAAAGPAPRGASGSPTGSARARTGACPRSSLAPILRFADVEGFVQVAPDGGKDGTRLDAFIQIGVAKEDQPHYLKVLARPDADVTDLDRLRPRRDRAPDDQAAIIATTRASSLRCEPMNRRSTAAWRTAGFDSIATVTLLMKETLVRVAEPALVPAGVR